MAPVTVEPGTVSISFKCFQSQSTGYTGITMIMLPLQCSFGWYINICDGSLDCATMCLIVHSHRTRWSSQRTRILPQGEGINGDHGITKWQCRARPCHWLWFNITALMGLVQYGLGPGPHENCPKGGFGCLRTAATAADDLGLRATSSRGAQDPEYFQMISDVAISQHFATIVSFIFYIISPWISEVSLMEVLMEEADHCCSAEGLLWIVWEACIWCVMMCPTLQCLSTPDFQEKTIVWIIDFVSVWYLYL